MRFDRFDRSFEDITSDDTTGAGRYEPVPNGTHDMEIKKVDQWQDKLIITFATASGSYAWVGKFLDPAEQKDHDLAICLLEALGLPADTDIDGAIIGRFVKVTTKRALKDGLPKLDKNGNQVVYVNGIGPSGLDQATQKPAAKRAPAARTNAQKVAQARGEEAGNDDDIPF